MSVAYAATWWALPGTVGAGVLKTEKSSCSKPKSQAAQTRKLETIKHIEALDEGVRDSAWEMDTVEGCEADAACLLTLFHRPTGFQLALLLEA